MATMTEKRENALIEKVLKFTSDIGKVEDAQEAESLDRMRQEIHAECEGIQADWAKDSESATTEATAETLEGIYKITDKDDIEKNNAAAAQSYSDFEQTVVATLAAGEAISWTELPGVISPNAAPPGSGAVPEFHWEEAPNKIAGAVYSEKGKVKRHLFIQPRLRIPAGQLSMFPSHKIGFAAAPDKAGERIEKTYRALAMDLKKFVSTTTTAGPGSPGAGVVPGGITFSPDPEMLGAYTGPMLNPMLWNVRVTPGDISRYRVLQFTRESASKPAAELAPRDTAADTDPTTAEVTVGAKKIKWDGGVSIEVLYDNYLNDLLSAYEEQALHEHKTEISEQLTTGTGVGVNPTGIMTHINAISGVPTLNVANNPVDAIALNQVTILQLKALLKPGLRKQPLVIMMQDALLWRMLISQLNSSAPGFSLPLDTSMADDDNGLHGKMWSTYLQANEGITADPDTAGNTIGCIVSGKSFLVRTTGTSTSMNPYDQEASDIISTYLRTWSDTIFTKPQVTGNFTAGRLVTT